MSGTYEGWSNQETWNMALVINNDQNYYNRKINMLKNGDPSAKDFKRAFKDATSYMVKASIEDGWGKINAKKINWSEIAEEFKKNYKYEH